MLAERLYTYPRRVTLPLEFGTGLLVAGAALNAGQAILDLILTRYPLDAGLLKQLPALRAATRFIQNFKSDTPTLSGLVGPLAVLCLALVVALLMRDTLPAVRTSARGLLVRFGADWLPVRWDGIQMVRLTESGDKFVALVQINRHQLTDWHRLWSFVYRFGGRRGFLISSTISHADELMGEIIDELKRRQKLGLSDLGAIDDRHRSPFFGLFLWGSRTADAAPVPLAAHPLPPQPAEPRPAASSNPAYGPVGGGAVGVTYPGLVSRALFAASALIAVLAVWQYVHAWITFLLYTFPNIRRIAFFGQMEVPAIVSPWGVLVGAHIGLLLVAGVVTLLYHLFPLVSADGTGLRVTTLGKTHHLPWSAVKVVKATSVDEMRHIVLVETEGRALPWFYRIGAWFYDSSPTRGVLIWPMARGFETLMQRIALELSRQGRPGEDAGPRLRDDAPGWLILLALRPAEALDRLVEAEHNAHIELDGPQALDRARLIQALVPMISLAVGPILLLLGHWVLFRGLVFSFQIPGVLLFGLLWGLAEWPLASMIAASLDQIVGGGTKGHAGLYLYPISQLPRLLPVILGLLLLLLGFPNLALVAMLGAIVWSAVLTAGLWEALYGWHGWPLVAGSAMTVCFQLLTLFGIAALR